MQGWKDSPLTEEGIGQAKKLAAHLNSVPFHKAWSSPSGRTMQTARLILESRHIPLEPMDAFREIRLGTWEGMLVSDIKDKYPEEEVLFWNHPVQYRPVGDGETFQEAKHRILPGLEMVLSQAATHDVLLVTHAATKKLIMSHFEGRPLERLWDPPFMNHTALSIIRVDGEGPVIETHGDCSHL